MKQSLDVHGTMEVIFLDGRHSLAARCYHHQSFDLLESEFGLDCKCILRSHTYFNRLKNQRCEAGALGRNLSQSTDNVVRTDILLVYLATELLQSTKIWLITNKCPLLRNKPLFSCRTDGQSNLERSLRA